MELACWGIVSEDAIWATRIHNLNDSKEFTFGRELAKKAITEFEKSADSTAKLLCPALVTYLDGISKTSVYVACFSAVDDSLSQWCGYCPPGFGYSLGFIAERLKAKARSQGFSLFQCIYNRDEQIAKVDTWVADTLQRLMASYNDQKDLVRFVQNICSSRHADIVGLFSSLKNPCFSDEREWRLVATVQTTSPNIKFRASKSMLVPYVPIALQTTKDESIFSTVRAGPTPHPALAIDSLSQLFRNIRVGLCTSVVPYRDW